MSLAHYIEGGKLARERAGSDLGRPQACKLSIRILQTVGAGCAGGAMRARSRPSPRFLELSESKNDTRRVAEAVLAPVGVAEEPGGQRIRRTEVGAQVIDLKHAHGKVGRHIQVHASSSRHCPLRVAFAGSHPDNRPGTADENVREEKRLPSRVKELRADSEITQIQDRTVLFAEFRRHAEATEQIESW